MVRKIFVIGGKKDPERKEKVFDLYVEWNDEFRELYDLGIVELSEELDKKYRSGLGFSNEKNGLATLRSQ